MIIRGLTTSPILILCEPPSEAAFKQNLPLHHFNWLARQVKVAGFHKGDICLMGLGEPIPKEIAKSAAKKWKHVETFQEEIKNKIDELQPRCIVCLGELAARTILGHPVSITKARGVPQKLESGTWVFPMLSPSFVNRIPDHLPIFSADLEFLKKFQEDNFQYNPPTARYDWIVLKPPLPKIDYKVIAVDSETQNGTRWWSDDVKLLSVQISDGPGRGAVYPVCDDWCGHEENAGDYQYNRKFLKEILEDESIVKIGHNIKFEIMMLRKIGIELKGQIHDSQLLLFNCDENIIDKSLTTGVSIYVPEMAGYDTILQSHDKSDMASVPRDAFIQYSAGDADATLRLAKRLKPQLVKDKRQLRCYQKIQMPAILEFANTVEPNGILIDKEKLRQFGKELDEYLDKTYKKLIKHTPAEVKKKHYNEKKELCDLRFSRADFLRDILFSKEGFDLEPVLFTEATQDLEVKTPATSVKHLLYFTTQDFILAEDYNNGIRTHHYTVGDYVTDLIGYKKAEKLKTTYSGSEEENTGLWQYIGRDGKIHPSYMLHRANTGRTASADPNGQNMPVRGDWAKKFDEVFATAPGFKRVSCDLSQIELRLVAWMAAEPTMLQIYQEGGDIHCKTAASVLGISLEEFMSWKTDENKKDDFSKHRYNAKATNFGFLYGLGARGFRVYAKTDYGIDYTEDECWAIRNNYFETYWGLPIWHNTMRDFAREHGYVSSLLGRIRHLPGIYSDDEAIVAQNLRFAINSPIQGMASELGVIALTRFCQNCPKDIIKPNAFIHDDIRAEVKEEYAEESAAALKWVVENPPWHWFDLECPVPILGEVKIDRQERPDIIAEKPDWWRE